jgi:uncharacterized protein YidB (DUF937 family)
MLKKRYKNKGIPVKGSEIRVSRTIRLSDSAWSGLDEVAKMLKVSRADLIEFWAAMSTHNEKKLEEIAANEGISLQELNNRFWEQLPAIQQQMAANKPSPAFPIEVTAEENS